MFLTRRRLIATAACAAALSPLAARPLRAGATPTGPVILTVTLGEGAAPRPFDLGMLDALPQRETVTATPWHEGRPSFSGPLISGLLDHVGAAGERLRVVALNDYAAEMPVADVRAFPVILATRQDGRPMPVRRKGPIFVIYPFDEHPELANEVIYGRSVWQVKGIEVLG